MRVFCLNIVQPPQSPRSIRLIVYLVIEIYMISGALLCVPVLERAIRSGAVLFSPCR